MEKKKRFIKEAISLTFVNIAIKIVSTSFMVYISNIVGAEGIGLYQLTCSLYYLFITFCTSGISTTITRLVSEKTAQSNNISAFDSFKKCTLLSFFISILCSFLMYFSADFLSINFLKDARASLSLKGLSLGLPFLSVGCSVRGYFLGQKQGVKASYPDILEMLIQIGIIFVILPYFNNKSIELACFSLVIASSVSEVISGIFAMLMVKLEKKEKIGEKQKGIWKKILYIMLTISSSNYIRSTLNTIENISIPQGLKKYGQNYSSALAKYGALKGMALPLLYFPCAILSAFANLLVPEVSAAYALNNQEKIDFIVKKSFKATLLYGFYIAGLFLAFSNNIAMTFYKRNDVSAMIFILAPLIPLMYLDQIVDSILKGLNQQVSSMFYNTADSILRVIIILTLTPVIGIKGYFIMFYAGTIFNATLSISRLIKVGKVEVDIKNWIILPIICCIISFGFSKLFIIKGQIICATAIYSILLYCFGLVSKKDVNWGIKAISLKK
ncbi:MAG: oligosaccharide flippase family protein [Oscillospiraceae bacterium]